MESYDDESVIEKVKALEGFMDVLYDYFVNKAICVTYVKQRAGQRPESDYSSAFLTFIDGLPVLMMAGHVCEAIKQGQDDGTLVDVSVIYSISKFNDERYPLDLDNLTMFWWDSTDDLDLGFAAVDLPALDRMRTHNVAAIPVEKFQPPSDAPDKPRMAFGFSAAHCVETDIPAYYIVSEGKIHPMMQTHFGSVARRFVFMNGFEERRNRQWVANPIRTQEACVRGMSGSFVVEMDIGQPVNEFRVVGIQSGQMYHDKPGIGRIATKFFVNDALTSVKMVQEAFNKNPDDYRLSEGDRVNE